MILDQELSKEEQEQVNLALIKAVLGNDVRAAEEALKRGAQTMSCDQYDSPQLKESIKDYLPIILNERYDDLAADENQLISSVSLIQKMFIDSKRYESPFLLQIAIATENLELCKLLFNEQNINHVYYYDDEGWGKTPLTLLHHAVSLRNLEIVKLCIALKADIDSTESEYGETPLKLSIDRDIPFSITQALIFAGADVNKSNEFQRTPLMEAVMEATEEGCIDKVRALLQAGAKIYPGTVQAAIQYGYGRSYQIVNLLVAYGANIEVVDDYYHNTPLQMADLMEDTKAAAVLLMAGAQSDGVSDDFLARSREHYEEIETEGLEKCQNLIEELSLGIKSSSPIKFQYDSIVQSQEGSLIDAKSEYDDPLLNIQEAATRHRSKSLP